MIVFEIIFWVLISAMGAYGGLYVKEVMVFTAERCGNKSAWSICRELAKEVNHYRSSDWKILDEKTYLQEVTRLKEKYSLEKNFDHECHAQLDCVLEYLHFTHLQTKQKYQRQRQQEQQAYKKLIMTEN